MNERSEFAQRLIEAVKKAGYEPRVSVIEKNFNLRYWGNPVSYQGIRRWLKGESVPEQDKLVVLAEWLGVEPYELRYGVSVVEKTDADKPWYVGLSLDDYDVIVTFLKLSGPNKKVVRDVVLALSSKYDEQKPT